MVARLKCAFAACCITSTCALRLSIARRQLVVSAAAASAVPYPACAKSDFKWGPFASMTPEEIEALGETSKREGAGILLPSGVRVIDLIEGTGPEVTPGRRVYAHYKVWSSGFREGAVADFSFYDERPCEHREIRTPDLM